MITRISTLILLLSVFSLAGCGQPVASDGADIALQTAPAEQARPGYMIVIGTAVDSARMGPYARATIPLLLEYGGELLFISEEGMAEVLEGGPFESSIRVFRFPSLQHARDFYHSERYQLEAIPLREGLGQLEVIVSDAFVPDPRWQSAP